MLFSRLLIFKKGQYNNTTTKSQVFLSTLLLYFIYSPIKLKQVLREPKLRLQQNRVIGFDDFFVPVFEREARVEYFITFNDI